MEKLNWNTVHMRWSYMRIQIYKRYGIGKRKKILNILNGHIFFHYNNKLCLSFIKELQDKINSTDLSKDFVSTESNGYKHTCDVKPMECYSKVIIMTLIIINPFHFIIIKFKLF